MLFTSRTLVNVMWIVTGLIMAASFQFKEPTAPIMAKLVLGSLGIPIFYLVREGLRRYRSQPKPPTIPPTLPRQIRRQIERDLKKADRLMRNHPCGLHTATVQTLIDNVQKKTGVKVNAQDVHTLVLAMEQAHKSRLASTTYRVV